MKVAEAKVEAVKASRKLTTQQQVFVDKLAEANIPVGYWFLPMSKFAGSEAIKLAANDYIENLKPHYAAGHNICFAGNYGIGKTYAICSILKSALIGGSTAYYTSLPEMSHMMTSKERDRYLNMCIRSDFLGLDEIDARHFSASDEAQSFFGSMIEKVVRSRIQNQLPLILATNQKNPAAAFAGQHGRVIESLLSPSCKVVTGLGLDFRKKDTPK